MNAPMRTIYVLEDRPPAAFAEFAMVRTKVDIVEGDYCVPKGSVGTIVHIYDGKDAFEVEFAQPVQAVVSARSSDLEPA